MGGAQLDEAWCDEAAGARASLGSLRRRIKAADSSLYAALRSIHRDAGMGRRGGRPVAGPAVAPQPQVRPLPGPAPDPHLLWAFWLALPLLPHLRHALCLALRCCPTSSAPSAWPCPCCPDLRCGLWYLPPRLWRPQGSSCAFKSTDGHTGNWAFSLTRLNLHTAFLAGGARVQGLPETAALAGILCTAAQELSTGANSSRCSWSRGRRLQRGVGLPWTLVRNGVSVQLRLEGASSWTPPEADASCTRTA